MYMYICIHLIYEVQARPGALWVAPSSMGRCPPVLKPWIAPGLALFKSRR